jgi:hypothetical protein
MQVDTDAPEIIERVEGQHLHPATRPRTRPTKITSRSAQVLAPYHDFADALRPPASLCRAETA